MSGLRRFRPSMPEVMPRPSKQSVVSLFGSTSYLALMPDTPERPTPANPRDLADALAFALRFHGRKRVHNADEIMAESVAKRLVEHLERAGFVFMQRAPIGGGSAVGRGFER
jgi:hypothetical protein